MSFQRKVTLILEVALGLLLLVKYFKSFKASSSRQVFPKYCLDPPFRLVELWQVSEV